MEKNWTKLDFKALVKVIVVVLKEFHPMGLAACDFLWLVEVLEVFVVCMDHNWVVGTQEVWMTTFESVDNGRHFFVMNVVILFSREESVGMEGNRMSSISELLTDDNTKGEV